MKVLYLTGMYPTPTYPQKGIFCHEQVKALKKIGVDVDVVVPMTVYDKEYTTKRWNYEGVAVRYLRFFKLPGTAGFQNVGKALYHSLMHSGIDFQKYDVFHADAPLPAGDAVRRMSEKYHIPFVVHGHGLDVFLEGSYKDAKNCKAIVEASKSVYRKANAIAGVSQKVLDQIQKKVDITGKAYVVYNGVDTERFHPVERTDTGKVTITSIGNLIPLKGHDYTLRAVKRLVDLGHKNIRLKIAGRGYLEDELKKLASELDITDYVEFIGYVPYEDIVKLLQSSDIFVLPSWYEALGCVYLEAMACGVPAIGCWGNGIDEVIDSGVNGFLIHNKNGDELVESLEKMLDRGIRTSMSQLCRITVSNRYTWINSAQSLFDLYMQVCY